MQASRSAFNWGDGMNKTFQIGAFIALFLCGAWSSAPAAAANPAYHHGPHTCKNTFVWRNAFDSDVVCVSPKARNLAAQENALAMQRVQPGRQECKIPYVWRVARPTDLVCVSVDARARVARENRDAYYRVVGRPEVPPQHYVPQTKPGAPPEDIPPTAGTWTKEKCGVFYVCAQYTEMTLDEGKCGCRLKK